MGIYRFTAAARPFVRQLSGFSSALSLKSFIALNPIWNEPFKKPNLKIQQGKNSTILQEENYGLIFKHCVCK